MPTPQTTTSFRLSETARLLLTRLSAKMGVNRTGIVELAIRQMAEREGVSADAGSEPESDPAR